MKWSFLLVASLAGGGLALAMACSSEQDDAMLPTGAGGDGDTTDGGGGTISDGGTGGDIDITNDPCQETPGEVICHEGLEVTCDDDGETAAEKDCGEEICVPGTGCVLCIEGMYSCFGNTVRVCNTGPPLTWDDLQTCNQATGEHCNPTTGTCEPVTAIGNGPSNPTGNYYQYAYFHVSSSAFRGGCDVDSYDKYIYVNSGNWYENGSTLDVYTVELLDSDGDGELEPNQHPDNPDKPGAIEERVLTFVTSYSVPGLGTVHHAEIQAAADRVFFLDTIQGSTTKSSVLEYVLASGQEGTVVPPTGALSFSQLGYDDVSGTWYAGYHGNGDRNIYSYHAPSDQWVAEFRYPNMTGGHMDGIDVVTDPNTGVAYVYVSDMTSDYLGQYRRDRGGSWEQVNLFEYVGTGDHVEGMGFGALNHFWATSGGVTQSGALYEIGGGDLTKYVEPIDDPR